MESNLLRPGLLVVAAVLATVATACGSGGDQVTPATAATTGATSGPTSATDSSTVTEASDGTGFLTVADLENPPQTGHFTGTPATLTARLTVTTNGCVTVTVDGVTRIPFRPPGTRVQDSTDRPGTYTVTVPGNPALSASPTTGDTFTATGVIDEEGAAFDAAGTAPDNKVSGLLAFCAVKAAPIAFRDPTTMTRIG